MITVQTKDKANEICRLLSYEMALPTSFIVRDGEVVFLFTILTNPPYSGEGRELPIPSARINMLPPKEIAKGIKKLSREELLATQLDDLIPDDF